jgi:hypothetical protein
VYATKGFERSHRIKTFLPPGAPPAGGGGPGAGEGLQILRKGQKYYARGKEHKILNTAQLREAVRVDYRNWYEIRNLLLDRRLSVRAFE